MEAWRQYRAFQAPERKLGGSNSEASGISTPLPSASLDYPVATDKYIYVSFEGDESSNPQKWSTAYKAWVLAILSFLTISLTVASAISAPTEDELQKEFGCSKIAATSTTAVFLIGIALGAMPAAPLSELYGRLPVYCVTLLLATLFEIACALAPNIGSLIALRFLAGLFSSAPISNVGGSLNDIGNPLVRTITLPIFSTAGLAGPVLGPIIGGFIVQNPKLGWRWVFWIAAIWNALAFVIVTLFMPETLGSVLLKYKASRLRSTTNDKRYRAAVEDESLRDATVKALERPFKLLIFEPIVQLFVLYLTIVYIVLFGYFAAYPIIFQERGLSIGQIGLTYIPIIIGFFILFPTAILHYHRYNGLLSKAQQGLEDKAINKGKVVAEERLIPMMAAGFMFPASLFWLAWTSNPHLSIWPTLMSGLAFGIGVLAIFQGSYQYMIDAYGPFAASALACSTMVRYAVSGLILLAFPKMYETMGTEWATSLLAFLALALTPVPFIFYHFGAQVRAHCQFTLRDV